MHNDKPRAYFAHSTHSFGTDTETRILKVLREKYRVICPNFDIGRLVEFKKYLNIVGWADMVFVWEYENYITMGVYVEVLHALKLGIPVWVVKETSDGFTFEGVERIEYQQDRTSRNHYGKLITQQCGSIVQ